MDPVSNPTIEGAARTAPSADARHQMRGVLLMTVASILFAVMGPLVRTASQIPGVSHFDVTFIRFAFGTVATIVYAHVRRRPIRIVNRRWFVIRGVLGGGAVLCYFFAIAEVGLAKGTTLNYTYLVWVTLLAPVISHERVSSSVWVSVLVACAGLYLVLAPSGGLGGPSWRDGAALASGLAAGVAILGIKRLLRTDSAMIVFLAQCVFGVLLVAYPALRDLSLGPPRAWLLMLVTAVVTACAQMMMTLAYKDVSGPTGALIGVVTPVATAGLGVWLFDEPLTFRIVVGSILVLAACAHAAVLGSGQRRPTQA